MQVLKHPNYPGAMTSDNIRTGFPFLWIDRLLGSARPDRPGRFTSDVMVDSHSESYVRVVFEAIPGVEVEFSLSTLGVLPSYEGSWPTCCLIEDDRED